MLERISRNTRLSSYLAAGVTLGFVGMTTMAQAQVPPPDNDAYTKITQVNVASVPYTCTFTLPSVAPPHAPVTFSTSSGFTFDISWVDQDRGEYLLAESSHGRPSTNTESGMLANATSGDLLSINTDNAAAGAKPILPPVNDPFAGHRCDSNVDFGGVLTVPPVVSAATHPIGDRNSISGPNGLFTMNGNQAWVGDGPSYFTPGQHDLATDYTTDPCDSSVRVFDLNTNQQIAHINVHGCFRTDEGAGDPVDQVALMANPGELKSVRMVDPNATDVDSSPFITLISTLPDKQPAEEAVDHANSNSAVSTKSFKILAQINFDGKTPGTVDTTPGCGGNCGGIEQAVYSRQTGLFYLAIPDNGTGTGDGFVSTIDPRPGANFGKVTTTKLNAGTCPGGPAGAALGPNHELLLGCGGGGGQVVVDITNLQNLAVAGANETVIGDGSLGCDEVWYDAGSGHFGGACMNNPASPAFNLLVDDAHTKVFDVALPGANGAHSITADAINANFWMPMLGGACGLSGGAGSPPQACVVVYGGNDSDAQGN